MSFRKDKVAYVEVEQEIDFKGGNEEDNEINVAELKPGPPCVCLHLKHVPQEAQEEKGKERSFNKKEYGFDFIQS